MVSLTLLLIYTIDEEAESKKEFLQEVYDS
jgi:hypothetical protein